LPPVPKIYLALAGLVLAVGCAAPVDRTRQLLELDLAHRHSAVESLKKKQETDPQPWQAYSLGVLYGADGDYENMNRWFKRCSGQTNTFDEDMAYISRGHWRDEAEAADLAMENEDWETATVRYSQALIAQPQEKTTRLRLIQARVMSMGPGLEEIRALVEADQPQVLYRWLEKVSGEAGKDIRLEVRVRLVSQLSGMKREKGDGLAFFLLGELNRMDSRWQEMQDDFLKAVDLNHETQPEIQQIRNAVSGQLLKESLAHWAGNDVPAALAKLDTADVVAPGRADIFQARRNITILERAQSPHQVAEALAMGDLDQRWLTFWMSRLFTRNRLREAAMVSNELLRNPENLSPSEKSQALRVRVTYARSIGNLDQARDDLRSLLQSGETQPNEAVVLGDILLAQSSYEEALHWFENAQQWGDDSVSLILKKARIAFSQDRFAERP